MEPRRREDMRSLELHPRSLAPSVAKRRDAPAKEGGKRGDNRRDQHGAQRRDEEKRQAKDRAPIAVKRIAQKGIPQKIDKPSAAGGKKREEGRTGRKRGGRLAASGRPEISSGDGAVGAGPRAGEA